MKRLLLAASTILGVLLVLGCGPASLPATSGTPTTTTAAPAMEQTQSSLARATPSAAATADLPALVSGNTAFALDLFRALSGQGNLVLSPYSVSLSLAMTWAGARRATEEEMAKVLHFDLPQERLHPAFNALATTLAGGRFQTSTSLWGEQGLTFRKPFLDLLATDYGAGLNQVDFIGHREEARQLINQWVADQTQGRVGEILPPGAVDEVKPVLVLIDAVHFSCAWEHPFMEAGGHEAPFHRLDGSLVQVPLMSTDMVFAYAEAAGWQAVELPYRGGDFSMVLLLPAAGTFADFVSALDQAKLAAIVGRLEERDVELGLPKFSYSSALPLRETLEGLGMTHTFADADFTGLYEPGGVWLGNVYHQTFISVDERGTEAASASAALMTAGAGAQMVLDRPFVYLIRDTRTGSILFLGQVTDPSRQ